MISVQVKSLLLVSVGLFFLFAPAEVEAQCNPSSFEVEGNGFDEDCDGLDAHFLHLPTYLYMVEGKSFELFFRNICLSEHPADYVYEVLSPLNGQNLGDKWTITPNAQHVGNQAFTVRIKHPYTGAVLATASTTVRVASASSPSTTPPQKVVVMGHSMVDQGILPSFLRSKCEELGNPPVSFHGSRVSWIDNDTHHQGKGGASWRYFYEDADSPFRFNGQLNIQQYFNENVCQGCDPDIFIIELGGNDYLFQGQNEGASIDQIKAFIEADYQQNVKPFIDALRAAAPNMKIGISMEIPGSGRPNAFPNFFGTNSVLGSHYRWRKIMNTILYKYSEKFGNREQENIYLLPIHLGVDDVNHFGDNDPVHPFPQGSMLNDPSGYPSMTTTMYAWMKYIFSQNQITNNSPKIDLELTITGNKNNPSIFSPFSATVTLHNYSNSIATNVKVSIPLPSDVIIVDPPFQASQGNYSWYAGKVWNVGTVPAQGSASITVNYYMMTGEARAFYAQVTSANQDDVDSEPNNGDGFDTNEDDEAKFVTNATNTGGGNQLDLELAISGDASQANAFSYFSTTVRLENKSAVQATNITVHCPRPQLSAYQGGNEAQTSNGTFNALNDAWYIPSLVANSSAELTINYFTLTDEPLDFYVQVEQASPTDVDSSPGNGNNQSAQEDDEALFKLNEQGTNCTIQVSPFDVLCNNNGTNNNSNDDTYTFKINPSGIANNWIVYYNGQNATGGIGETKTLGPFPIASTTFLQIKDALRPECAIDLTVAPPTACSNGNTGNCLSQSDFPWHEWISRVQVGSFTKNSGKMGYSDFTNDVIDVQPGQYVNCSIQATYSFFTHAEKVKIWIDYNQNGIYEEPNELAFATTITPPAAGVDVSKTVIGSWTIPPSAANGLARMRISMQRGLFAEACGNFTFGEVEDYTVRIGGSTSNALFEGTDLRVAEQGNAILYPNPSYAEAFIALADFVGKKVDLSLVDGFGRSVWQKQCIAEEQAIRLKTSDFSAGLYALHIRVEGERPKTIKLLVQE